MTTRNATAASRQTARVGKVATKAPRPVASHRRSDAGTTVHDKRKVTSGRPTLVTLEPETGTERLIKSAERVRDLAEVFTPAAIVQEMLDTLPAAMWAVHPSPSFLEPACGDGNFLVAVLDRKLRKVGARARRANLPAGNDEAAILFHALEALASIYAVDISPDNIIGGSPGHEVGARERLLRLFQTSVAAMIGRTLTLSEPSMKAAAWIVAANVQVGNMLPSEVTGSDAQDNLPLVEYRWDASAGEVAVFVTTLGSVIADQLAEARGEMTLFGPVEPVHVWSGAPVDLAQAKTSRRGAASRGGRSC